MEQSILDTRVSMFAGALGVEPIGSPTLREILSDVTTGKYKAIIEKLRKLRAAQDKPAYEEGKKKLPGFTLSAQLKTRSSKIPLPEKLIAHTHLLQIDIDEIPAPGIEFLEAKLRNDPLILFSFRSPSGDSLKVGIRIDGTRHHDSYLSAEKYFRETYQVKIDAKVKEVPRLCFVSYDPHPFINEQAGILPISLNGHPKTETAAPKPHEYPPSGRRLSHGERSLETARNMIDRSVEGEKLNDLLKAAKLLGGYVAGRMLSRSDAEACLRAAIEGKQGVNNLNTAYKAIASGLDCGEQAPFDFEDLERERISYGKQKNPPRSIMSVAPKVGESESTPESHEPPSDNEAPKHLEEFNAKHAVIMLGGKCAILNEIIDPIFNRPDITFSAPADFKTRYANRKIFLEDAKGTTRSYSAANLWLQDENRREYDGIVFAPGQTHKGFYNLYRGLGAQPLPGKWDLLREHIFENICSGSEEYFKYLMDWMADFVQNPGGRGPGVSVVLRGGRGTGKGLFATSFGKIFGSHFLHLRDQNHLTGRFNAHHKDALLLFADECFWAGNKTSEGLLKGLITEETIQIEAKGKDTITVMNHIRLIIASNEDWVVPAGLDERRFFCLDVCEEQKQKISYWNPIWEETRKGGIEAMLHDLLKRSCDHIALKKPPRTEAMVCQIEHSLSSAQQWWYQCLMEGRFQQTDEYWLLEVATEDLYSSYLAYCKSINERYPEPKSVWAKSVRKLCQINSIRLPPEQAGGIRPWGLRLPTLDICRETFKSLLGTNIDWEMEES